MRARAHVPASDPNPLPKHPTPEAITLVIADAALGDPATLQRRFSPAQGFSLAQVSGTPAEILAGCRKLAPCVLVIEEAGFRSFDTPEFASLVDFGRSVQVLVTGARKSEGPVQELLQKGCMGFLADGAPPAVLKRAIRAVARGELWVDRCVVTRVLQNLLFSLGSPRLTPREKDILALIAAGCKNRVIADQLCISYETVRWHIRGLHAKLGVQDRLGTALYAQQILAQSSRK